MFFRALNGQFVEAGELAIVREFGETVVDGLPGFIVFAGFKVLIDLANPAGTGFFAQLAFALELEALDLGVKAGILRINVVEDVPLAERLVELRVLLILLGPADDGVKQIAAATDEL